MSRELISRRLYFIHKSQLIAYISIST